jgi:hypothetical protein
MSQDQQDKPSDRGRRHDRFELYFYEKVGDRYYLRITRFSLYLMIGLAAVGMPFLLLMDSRSGVDNVNVQIGPRDTSKDRPPPTFEPIPLRNFGTPAGQGAGAATPSRRRRPSPTPTPPATPAALPRPDPTRSPSPPGPAG